MNRRESRTLDANPLAQRDFVWYFASRNISLLGSVMAPVAVAFAVLEHSDRPLDLGIILAARSVPLIAFLLVGGAVADRFPRVRVLAVSNLGAAATQSAAAYLLISGHYGLAIIAVIELLNGCLSAFTSPAVRGIVPELVEPEQRQRANSLLASARNMLSVVGPTVAGIAVMSIGGGWAIAVDALSFFVAALLISRVRLGDRSVSGTGGALTADIRQGWHEFRSYVWIWSVVLGFAVMNCIQVGIWTVVGPVIATQSVGAAAWGLVLSARAVGLLVAGVAMYRVRVGRLLLLGISAIAVLGSLPLFALGVQAGSVTLLCAAFLAGIGSGCFGIAWETSLQEHVPNEMLSRISSYDDTGSFVAVPLGQLAAGPLAVLVGSTYLAVIGGVIYVTAGLLPLASRQVRSLRQPRKTTSGVP